MFSFMKKDKEKDKKKEEKLEKKKKEKDEKVERKEKEKKERQNMTPEEMSRLEEMKKGVLRRFSDRDKKRSLRKSGENQDHPSPTESESSDGIPSARSSPTKEAKPLTKPQPLPRQQVPAPGPAGKNPPPAVLPKPKGILKGKGDASSYQHSDLDDSKLLQENTKRNEDLFIAEKAAKLSEALPGAQKSAPEVLVEEEETVKLEPYASKLKLPPISPAKEPRIREIVVHRNQAGGFGFSLRKGIIPEHGGGAPRVVTFAEPGSGQGSNQTGLLPGDRLVEVNGQNIEKLTREDIVEIIKKSPDTMTLKVQPISELIELSVRPNKDGTTTDILEDAAKSGTLKRTGSLRYKKGVSEQFLFSLVFVRLFTLFYRHETLVVDETMLDYTFVLGSVLDHMFM
ncbi:Unconventional myosin-XVIIIa [Bulinus truncatus]|nr:Unconventional myosin-XVIIIa [Bulinus truncatus]